MSSDDAPASDTNESELFTRLAELSTPELAVGQSERVHRRARAAFVHRRERAKHPWFDRLSRLYTAFEPVMAMGVASAYLLWAFTSAMALYH